MSRWSQSLSRISQGLLFLDGHFATPAALPSANEESSMNLRETATPADTDNEFDFAGGRGARSGFHVVSEQWFGPAVAESDLAQHRSQAAKLRLVDRRTASAFDQG